MIERLTKKLAEMTDEKKVQSSNFWNFLLIAFIVLWMVGAYLYLDGKSDVAMDISPVVVLDSVTSLNLTNFFQASSTNFPVGKSAFINKEKYSYGELVIVKAFYVEALVIEVPPIGGTDYTLLYKDHNHVLQKIILPKTMLMSPVNGGIDPVSLLVD
jgi:hypothetical protein